MTNWILRWFFNGIALAIVANLGIGVHYDSVKAICIATVVIGLVNSLIRPVLMLLTLPLSCITFGLFGFVLNAMLFMIAGNAVNGFHVDGLIPGLLGSILMGLLSGILCTFMPDKKEKEKEKA